MILAVQTVAAAALAQQNYEVPDSTHFAPPPLVAFDDWRQEREEDFSREYRTTFPSAIQSGFPENDRVPLRVYLPAARRGPFPCVLLLHFWGATDLRVEESLAERLNERGIAAAVMPLPYHLGRTPAGRRSGELAIQPDPAILSQTTIQSVSDCRRAVDFLATRPEIDSTRLAVSGTSLGSIIGSLVFAVEPRFKHASFSLGGIDLAHILWKSSVVAPQREAMRRQGFTEERLREALAKVEPGNYLRPLQDGRKALVIVAKYDQVIPRKSTDELAAKLATPYVVELDSGHYGGIVVQNQILRAISRFYDAVFQGKEYTPPKSLSTPTIRVGLTYNQETGFQVAAGVEVWRSGNRWMASPLLTPKGVQGYVGYMFNRETSVGLSITPKRTTLGVFWSRVL